MTATTYDVRLYKTVVYEGARVTSYRVRWKVSGRERNETFRNSTQAKNFKSALRSAASRGEASTSTLACRSRWCERPASSPGTSLRWSS